MTKSASCSRVIRLAISETARWYSLCAFALSSTSLYDWLSASSA